MHHKQCSIIIGERHERTCLLVDPWAGLGNQKPLTPPLSMKGMVCSPFPQWDLFSRMQPWGSSVMLRPFCLVWEWSPLKASVKTFKKLMSRGGDLLVSGLPKSNRVHKVPAYETCHLLIWSGLLFESLLAHPPCVGCFRFHQEAPEDLNQWWCMFHGKNWFAF